MKEQTFTLGEVLTVLTGIMLCDVGGLYRVLNFLTDEELYTHQLPRAFRVASPFVAQQHPDLTALDWSHVDRTNYRMWLAKQVKQFGPTGTLRPLPSGAYEAPHPIEELIEMRGGDDSGIVVINQRTKP